MVATDTVQKFFRTSSGIKDIVGRELITDDFVAVFELVKNSFDAVSSRVDLVFEDDALFIIDDGKGMTSDELFEKWLFLGYSAKSDGEEAESIDELENTNSDFRNRIKRYGRGFAGNKGIGRFSCDRLGSTLELCTRSVSDPKGQISCVNVDWEKFEEDTKAELENVPVDFWTDNELELPAHLDLAFKHGTFLKISSFRASWPRKKILSLKSSLAKLINPFDAKEELQIYIHCPREKSADEKVLNSQKMADLISEFAKDYFDDAASAEKHIPTHNLDIVNGRVQNPIFEKISKYTTNIRVSLSQDSKSVRSQLFDRGELILEFNRPNKIESLKGSDLNVEIHYLNTAARRVFTRFMGQQATQFGHVFLFNNGFRVFPVGEPGVDTFGLDTRKNQGRTRYIGTREIVGKIDILSSDSISFKEASSRNAGLIKTDAYRGLENFFMEYCIKLLERYVVNVNWVDKLDRERLDVSGLETDIAKSRIIRVVSSLVKDKEIELIHYSANFLTILDEKSANFSDALKGLEIVAEKIGDLDLREQLSFAQKRHAELVEAQLKAKEEAEAEKEAREKAEEEAQKEKEAREDAEQRADDAEKRASFFASLSTDDYDNLVDYLHQAGVYSSEINNHIALKRKKIAKKGRPKIEETNLFLERVELANSKIQSIVNFSTKANFVLDGEELRADLAAFIPDYIEKICTVFAGVDTDLIVTGEAEPFELEFKPIELFIVIDNLVHNSKKAGAKKIWFNISTPEKNRFLLEVTDNGKGLSKSISDVKKIFDRGVTTTTGSGLGLHFSREIIADMGGNISAELLKGNALRINLEFAK